MGVERFYKILVVGGALLNAGCGANPGTEPKTQRESKSEGAKKGVANPTLAECAKICSGTPENGLICPDPSQDGLENCCWLMPAERHPCCPS